ncbi:sigma-70 family RNA polymerase sigma factor [Streptomyces sp. NBC_01476]|uniref:sigma-70 family RNA polymerase sigma factor n=1 Tax=Streptomyces sp. NBC_01476 TaxID=2903881 RepID=UPI002E324C70|nr:sigma-70 family RNA polymerase sigma factor [Streptomyces sp. NBC_01476]
MAAIERGAIEAELPFVIERLKRCASPAGVVSQRAFALEAGRLGLRTTEQQRRLRNGLAAVGIHVKLSRRGGTGHRAGPVPDLEVQAATSLTKTPAPPTEVPEPGLGATEAASRLAQARRMLARYADIDGTVSKLAHDGVVRLHGLNPAEVRELTADFPITRPGTPRVFDEPVERRGGRPVGPALAPTSRTAPVRPPVGKAPARVASAAVDARLAEAVRAARAVLEADRWRRDPARVVLKAEEEVGLAVLLRGGTDLLSRDVPPDEIAALLRDGERWHAYECLVLHNQRLVWKIAQGYQGRGLDIEDSVQHGSVGLLRAVRKFDATQGNKLSTYATWWIKQAITRAIADEGNLIRLPVHLHEKVSKVAAAERKLLGEGRARTVENVAYVTGLTFAEVEKIRRISRSTDSLDRIVGDDAALGELIIGPSRLPGPSAVVLRKEFFEQVGQLLDGFTERERHVLVRRAGLDGDEPATLDAIGAVFGVTRERIRQIEGKAKPVFRDGLIRLGIIPSRP